MVKFALEVKQGGVWLHKGSYSSVRTAMQAGGRRFPNMSYRVINHHDGSSSVVSMSEDYGFDVSMSEDYGFEIFEVTLNSVRQETTRLAGNQEWYQRHTMQRAARIQELEEQRERERWLRHITPPLEVRKVRRPHIRWWIDGF